MFCGSQRFATRLTACVSSGRKSCSLKVRAPSNFGIVNKCLFASSAIRLQINNASISRKNGVQIRVTPEQPLGDEKFRTVVTGLPTENKDGLKRKVTLKLEVKNASSNLHFSSAADYEVASGGSLDLDLDPPLGHAHPDPMRPFWSMKPLPGSSPSFCSSNAEEPHQCHYQVVDKESGQVLAETRFQRLQMAPGVRRIVVNQGRLKGTLFLPPQTHQEGQTKATFPAVIKLYGGLHRGRLFEDKAAALASRGFVCFVMAFFGLEGLPKSFLMQPLDVGLFEEAVDFLRDLPEVKKDGGGKVGFFGFSKGCEVALTATAFLPEGKVASVVCQCAWINLLFNDAYYKGEKVLGGQYYKVEDVIAGVKTVENEGDDEHGGGNGGGLSTVINMRGASDLIEAEGHPSTIPFHRQKSVMFMFVAGEDDQNHDAMRGLRYAKRLSEESGHSGCQFHSYEDLGHMVSLPYDPPIVSQNHPFFPKDTVLQMGGSRNPEGHVKAQVDIWKKSIEFLRQTLA